MKICSKCNINKLLSEFNKNTNRCRVCLSLYNKNYNENNKVKIKLLNKNYYEKIKNSDNYIKKIQIYRENNKEKIAFKCKNYYEDNKNYINSLSKIYRAENPFIVLSCKTRSADKKKNRKHNILPDWIFKIFIQQDEKCYYCNIKLCLDIGKKKYNQISVDRIDSNIGHLKYNCVISCMCCNYMKNRSSIQHFLYFLNVLTGNKTRYYI